jgi:hypothetical protein
MHKMHTQTRNSLCQSWLQSEWFTINYSRIQMQNASCWLEQDRQCIKGVIEHECRMHQVVEIFILVANCFLCFDLCKLVPNTLWFYCDICKVFQCILNMVGYALKSHSFFFIVFIHTCILGLHFDICFWYLIFCKSFLWY